MATFAEIRRLPLWQAEDFAALLGLRADTTITSPNVNTETERLDLLISHVQRVQMELETAQNSIYAKFCALYLPGTVERFLDPPASRMEPADVVEDLQLNNAYLQMLAAVQHTGYFFKYFRSQSSVNGAGKNLTQTVAQRLVTLGPKWNDQIHMKLFGWEGVENAKAVIATALQLLSTLLAIFIKEVNKPTTIAPQTRAQLQRMLREWGARYIDEFLGQVSMRTLKLLSGDQSFERNVKRVIRRDLKGWEVCAMHSCDVTTNLKACGKCQTVRYCSPEHQREHWKLPFNPHKDMCHKTVY